MEPEIRQMIDAAYAERRANGPAGALTAYREAAERGRAIGDSLGRAHALRHVSDLARELGDIAQAREAALEAVAAYRPAGERHALDLANALRLLALAEEGKGGDAADSWREARELYHDSGIEAGVAECDAHLPG